MKLARLAMFLALPILLAGCHITSSTPSTAPTQGYQQAAQAMSDFATDLKQVQQIEVSLHNGGVIDSPTHVAIQTAIKSISMNGKQADALIKAEAGATNIQARINAALDAANSIALATGKLDPSTAAQLTNAVSALKLLLNNVITALPIPTSEVIYGSSNYSYAG